MCRIINYGSLNIDKVYTVDAFVRPGETIHARSYELFPGGKGLNQSVAAARAGSTVLHVGCIGSEGDFLLKTLKDAGVQTRLVWRHGPTTGHAVIQVNASGENCIIIHGGSNQAIPDDLRKQALQELQPGDILTLQNEVNGNLAMIEGARSKKARVALNPSPFDASIEELPLDLVSWLFINKLEGAGLTGQHCPEAICRALLARFPGLAVVLTLGDEGSLYWDAHTRIHQKAYEVCVLDTTAAGDTFTGFFLSGLARNLPLQTCLQVASKAAALTVSKKGASVAIPTLEAVEKASLPLREGAG